MSVAEKIDRIETILGRILYEELERLDPGSEEYVEWEDLIDRDRTLYKLCIRRLSLDHDMFTELDKYTQITHEKSLR